MNSLLKKATSIGDIGLPKEWLNTRCDLCTFMILAGERYISFTPQAYKDRKRLNTGLIHINCLDFHDRKSYPRSTKTAVHHTVLLTSDWISDIILKKESNG